MKVKNTYFDAFKKVKQKKGKSKDTDQYKLSLWDFGGQYIFYATHQLFHSRHAIYLLVFDLTRELHTPVTDEDYPGGTNHMRSMENYIEFWISSVHSYVGTKDGSKPNIILVGTFFDKLGDKSKADKYFEDVRKLFDGRKMGSHIYHETFAIAGTDKNDQEIVRLKKTILEIGMKDRPLIPARWIPLEFELRKRQEESIVKYQDIVQMNDKDLEHPIPYKEQLKSFLKFHHANGTFIYFDEGVLADYVVVNPSFLVNAFKCIITSRKYCRKDKSLRSLWNELESRAILKQALLLQVWSNDKSSQFIKYKDVLVVFLKKHRIISEALKFDEESEIFFSLDYYIVPSFLKEPDNGEIKRFLENRSRTSVSLVFTFDNEAVVSTVYQRLTGAAVGTWPVVEFENRRFLFENASVFRINLSYAVKFIRVRNTIELLILHMCEGGKISAEMPDFLRRFAENVFNVEFKKLQNIEDSQEVIPYTISFRCQHSLHKHEGSKVTYGLEMLKGCKEKTVCCPDNIVHENIDIDKIFHEWFTYEMIDKKIPDRRLSDRELVELTQAIGSEWELLGNYLGVNCIALQHIKLDNDTTAMMILEMLRRWDQDKMQAATLNELVTAINKLPNESVDKDVVKNVIDGIYNL
jgi:GTPase SAR1 family protein